MNPILELLGRRLRLAVVGGGPGSFIGPVHRTAARLDDRFEIVAGVLSGDPTRSRMRPPASVLRRIGPMAIGRPCSPGRGRAATAPTRSR